MKKILIKFWHWLRCEDENGKPILADNNFRYGGIPLDKAFRYSELIDRFPLRGKVGDDDIIQISHKADGGYETCYITVKQLKDAVCGKELK